MNREFLEKQGLPKDQVDMIMAEHGKAVQANQSKLTTAEDRVKALETDLGAANKLVADLKKSNKDTEALQKQITDYEAQMTKLESERANERKTNAIKEALRTADATDIEYMTYKLGEVELDKDGKIKDIENKIKALKETNPSFFKAADPKPDPEKDPKAGFKPIVVDNKLPGGGKTTLDLKNMSVDEINAHWDAIKAQNKK